MTLGTDDLITELYTRRQGDVVFKFYIQDRKLIAKVIQGSTVQQLPIGGIPYEFQTDLEKEKIAKLKAALEQCYFSMQRGKIQVTARGLGGWNDEVHQGYKGDIGSAGQHEPIKEDIEGSFAWAYDSGFGVFGAKTIADSCCKVDYGKLSPLVAQLDNITSDKMLNCPQSWHFNMLVHGVTSGAKYDTRIQHAVTCLMKAIKI